MSKSDPEDERRLFREAMRGVRPLSAPPPPPQASPPAPAPRRRRGPAQTDPADGGRNPTSEAALHTAGIPLRLQSERGEVLEYRAPGVQRTVLRNLRRGQYAVEGSLDLHGLTAMRAAELMREYLTDARRAGVRCVRLVHGKGLGSGNRGPVLKSLVNAWLRDQPWVLAFASAPRDGGDTGATLVLLSRRQNGDGG